MDLTNLMDLYLEGGGRIYGGPYIWDANWGTCLGAYIRGSGKAY